jgi:ornithine cyclodeaminase
MSASEGTAGPRILRLQEIRRALEGYDPVPAMEAAFRAYSEGRAVVPSVGELLFDSPPGDAHIKYGYIRGGAHFAVKVAAGFYDNAKRGLPPFTGLLMLFSQQTGLPAAILLDEGWLTNLRTAAAGAVAAKYLAPRQVQAIGAFGTGTQARLQVDQLRAVTDCRDVVVWGRSEAGLAAYQRDMTEQGFRVTTTREAAEIGRTCNLIVTATPATSPLLLAAQVRPGTHVTAVGSDTSEKQELDPAILAGADLLVADSLTQCRERGEIHHALKAGRIAAEKPVELGRIVADPKLGRTSEDQITVADLTGLAVQDIMIAEAVLDAATGAP